MKRFCHAITKGRWVIIVASLLLLIPSVFGYFNTKINYDLITYLPKDVETMKGENILTDDFKQGAFSVVITENMNAKQILQLEKEIKKVDTVNRVGSVYDIIDAMDLIENYLKKNDMYDTFKREFELLKYNSFI